MYSDFIDERVDELSSIIDKQLIMMGRSDGVMVPPKVVGN